MQIEQKKTLTEECWITVGEGDTTFDVRIDYPVYPNNATLTRLSSLESIGIVPPESYWSFYVRSIVRDYKNLFDGDKEYHPTVERGLLSTKDFDLLDQMGVTTKIFVEGNRRLEFNGLDKKKL